MQVGYSANISSEPAAVRLTAGPDASTEHELLLAVGGMTCASCAGIIDSVVRALPGVRDVSVNVLMAQARVTYQSDLVGARTIIAAIVDVCVYICFDLLILCVF